MFLSTSFLIAFFNAVFTLTLAKVEELRAFMKSPFSVQEYKTIQIPSYAVSLHQVNKKIVSIELINQSGDNIKRALCMLQYAVFGYHRPSTYLRQGRAFIRTVPESVCSHPGITLIIREVAIQESPPFRSGIHTTSITTLRSH